MQLSKKLSDFIGKNEKTKVIAKIQKVNKTKKSLKLTRIMSIFI
jgi:hypothetical protein